MYTKEAAEVEIRLRGAQETLAAAEGLVEKLNDEYDRWQLQVRSCYGINLVAQLSHCGILVARIIRRIESNSNEKSFRCSFHHIFVRRGGK